MIKKALQISGLLISFLLVLTISINDKPIFFHIYDLISPGTKYVQSETSNLFRKAFDSTSAYTRKIFVNSIPRVKDSVGSKQSAHRKTSGEPEEKVSSEDKQELDQLIKNH